MTARRYLRPRELVPVRDEIWAFDEFHPVAAVLDAASGEARGLVNWCEVAPYPVRHVAGDGRGVWVQPSPSGPLIRLGTDGVEFVCDVRDAGPLGTVGRSGSGGGAAGLARQHTAGAWTFRTVLVARNGAWSVPVNPPDSDNAQRRGDPPRQALGDSVLRFTALDGQSCAVHCEGRIVQVAACGGAGYLRVEAQPASRRQVPVYGRGHRPLTDAELPSGTARWALQYRNSWLRLPDDGRTVDAVTVVEHGVTKPPRTHGHRSEHYAQMAQWYREGAIRRRDRAGGLDWIWGWQEPGDEGIWGRRIRATGHDPSTRRRRRSVDLGPGWVEAWLGDGRYLWLTIRRRLVPGLRYPTEVVRIDGTTGDVQPVLGPDEVDIAGHGWPLVPEPAGADEHVRRERARVLATVQPSKDRPPMHGPAEGPSDLAVDVAGRWPDTTVRLRFRHRDWPGLLMQRDLPVFDELGRCVPADLEWAGWRLHYWLDARLAPPPRDAVDGVLEL